MLPCDYLLPDLWREVRQLRGDSFLQRVKSSPIRSLKYNSLGTLLASTSFGEEVRVWDANLCEQTLSSLPFSREHPLSRADRLSGRRDPRPVGRVVSWHPTEPDLLAFCATNSDLHLWRLGEDPTSFANPEPGFRVYALQFQPSALYLGGSLVTKWDLETQKVLWHEAKNADHLLFLANLRLRTDSTALYLEDERQRSRTVATLDEHRHRILELVGEDHTCFTIGLDHMLIEWDLRMNRSVKQTMVLYAQTLAYRHHQLLIGTEHFSTVSEGEEFRIFGPSLNALTISPQNQVAIGGSNQLSIYDLVENRPTVTRIDCEPR